jgi:hypothetical protein
MRIGWRFVQIIFSFTDAQHIIDTLNVTSGLKMIRMITECRSVFEGVGIVIDLRKDRNDDCFEERALSVYLSLHIYLSTSLSTYLPTFLPSFLPIYLSL